MEEDLPGVLIFLIQVAPMKALCSERFTDWSTKFEPFGLRCKEVTGDSELDDYYELQNVHIIMTTPVSLIFNNDAIYGARLVLQLKWLVCSNRPISIYYNSA